MQIANALGAAKCALTEWFKQLIKKMSGTDCPQASVGTSRHKRTDQGLSDGMSAGSHNFGKVGDGGKLTQQLRKEVKPINADLRVGVVDQHVIEKGVDLGAEGSHSQQSALVGERFILDGFQNCEE